MRVSLLAGIAFALAASPLIVPVARAQAVLPDGEGKEVVQRLCTTCHGPENFINKKLTRDGWDAVIYSMEQRGFMPTDEEVETILNYCTKYLGGASTKVNVNRATAKELESGLDLPSDQAAAIVRYRADKGDFRTWQDVAKVPGVEARRIEDNKDRIAF